MNEHAHTLSNMISAALRFVIVPIYFSVMVKQFRELSKFSNGYRKLRILLLVITATLTLITIFSMVINILAANHILEAIEVNTIQPVTNTITQLIVALMLYLIYSGKY